MKTDALKGAAATAAFAVLVGGAAAHAGDLHGAYTLPNNQNDKGIATFDTALSAQTNGINLAQPPVGLAAGNGSLFVSTVGGPSNNIERYDLNGAQTAILAMGPLSEAGALAFGGGALYGAFATQTLGGTAYEVASLTADLDFDGVFGIEIPSMATGLAFGDGNVFVAYDSVLARYGLDGQLLGLHDFGTVSFSALTYGAGQLFAGYHAGSGYGFASVDPLSWLAGGANVATDLEVNGLAFGDGVVFASFDDHLAKYDLAGQQLAMFDTGRQINGALAFMDASAAPEPSSWALMILGFASAGAALRSRRGRLVL